MTTILAVVAGLGAAKLVGSILMAALYSRWELDDQVDDQE